MIGRIKKVGGRGRVRQEEERRGKGSLRSEDKGMGSEGKDEDGKGVKRREVVRNLNT